MLDDKEKEKLEAFEKECISNQLTLQESEANQRKKSSGDSNSEVRRFGLTMTDFSMVTFNQSLVKYIKFCSVFQILKLNVLCSFGLLLIL